MAPITLTKGSGQAIVEGADFKLVFDQNAGAITEWSAGGKQIITKGPQLNIFRSPTDNDGFKQATDWVMGKDYTEWKALGLDELGHTAEAMVVEQVAAGMVKVTLQTIVGSEKQPEAFLHQHSYTIYGDGTVQMENEVQVNVNINNLPRVGVTLNLHSDFEQFDWFGRGPVENYRDRNAGTLVGKYASTVSEQFVPYIMPQANGNKTDVRQVWLTDESGQGLEVSADSGVMEVTASHHTEEGIYKAFHTNELTPIDDVVLHLDHIHAAIGGASCGPATLPEYLIKPGTYRFGFTFRPVK